jgi:N-acetylneuraminate synthase
MKNFNFNDLFVFDLANNHQGDVSHGKRIIREIGKVVNVKGIRAAFKFQLRQLDTFIHEDYKHRKDFKHIPRFLSTRLSDKDFTSLLKEVKAQRMITMATPFDEESVHLILEWGIEIIKIASCSATDRPLLERVAEVNRPVIISTAGLSMSQIDRLVSFFEHKGIEFALMHCAAIYPTPHDMLRLNQIALLKARFPELPIGFSTHESPDNYSAIQIAYAKGARIFERHVGLATPKYKLNEYSSTPMQLARWLESYFVAVESCGGEERSPAIVEEMSSLHSLMRGVFAKKEIKKGEPIKREEVFFAMPLLEGQLTSGEWHNWLVADKHYARNAPLNMQLANLKVPEEELIYQIMLQVKGMLNNAKIFIGRDSSVEVSHHYGLERFREFGCVIINCINRAYCKKIIVQLPRQKHPYHYHDKKEETFQLLYGDLEVELEGKRTRLDVGDTSLIKPKQWHKFHTLDGAIFEEVSTTHYNEDSLYEDEKIARFPREKRKTKIDNWEAAVSTTD